MSIIIPNRANPHCPLCDKPFHFLNHKGRSFYVCKLDQVAIDVRDPMVGHWNNHKDLELNMEIPCPNKKCRDKMNLFCRSDGYMKAVCSNPKCRSSVSTDEIDDGHYIAKKGEGDRIIDL